MSTILLVYYSRTGTTRRAAEELRQYLPCDVEEIREERTREGKTGYARSLFDVLMRRHPAIRPSGKDLAGYDMVVIATPVWASDISSPVRSYVLENRDRFKRIAAFCTMGGTGGNKALDHMAHLCQRTLAARLVLTDAEIESGLSSAKLKAFANAVAHELAFEAAPV
ncbi:MAG TPA: flavodoxin [Burkholderiaceae bacterium]